jgi:hypothetical protein
MSALARPLHAVRASPPLSVALAEARRERASQAEDTIEVSTIEAFSTVEEPGAEPLIGDPDNVLIGEGGDVTVYGDGGSGKTTLMMDAACHLGAGQDWLGLRVPRPLRVLLIEVEGPRPLMRGKLRRKLEAWGGKPIEGRVLILSSPWAKFTFASEGWRDALARIVLEQKVDIIIAGPLTRIGMEEAGTLQQTRDFMRLVDDVRARCARRIAVVLIHHENKAGAISGAWEGAGDTLLHVEARGPGRTHLHIEKARWSSVHHNTRLDLAWAEGEGFDVGSAEERDYHAEIEALLTAGGWRTVKEIAAKKDASEPGIGAGEATIKEKLAERPEVYVSRNGGEVGRSARATVYQLRSAQNAVDAVGALQGEGGTTASTPLTPEGSGDGCSAVQDAQPELHSAPSAVNDEGGETPASGASATDSLAAAVGAENGHRDYTDAELQALIDAGRPSR